MIRPLDACCLGDLLVDQVGSHPRLVCPLTLFTAHLTNIFPFQPVFKPAEATTPGRTQFPTLPAPSLWNWAFQLYETGMFGKPQKRGQWIFVVFISESLSGKLSSVFSTSWLLPLVLMVCITEAVFLCYVVCGWHIYVNPTTLHLIRACVLKKSELLNWGRNLLLLLSKAN